MIVDAIKLDEFEIEGNSDKSNLFIAKIEYCNLNKLCKLGNVSINREVDKDRAKNMVKYIKEKGTFYPTIVVATNKKNTIEYSESKKIIDIKVRDNTDKFIVLDGQHRFQSITMLEDINLKKNRYQSVLIIENINKFQQRKIFIDINDTPKKVTTGTKARFDKTIANYFSLTFLDLRSEVLKYILMDSNQTTSNKRIPYKYFLKFNEKLVYILSNSFNRNESDVKDLDKYKNDIIHIDEFLIDIIEFSQINNYQITKYELFYVILGEYLSKYIDEAFESNKTIDIKKIKLKMEKVKNNLEKISKEFIENIPKSQIEKREKIRILLIGVLGE